MASLPVLPAARRPGSPSSLQLFLLLVALRLLDALTARTFFQPDEYFQALEPAWRSAFGASAAGSLDGPWITWVWLCFPP